MRLALTPDPSPKNRRGEPVREPVREIDLVEVAAERYGLPVERVREVARLLQHEQSAAYLCGLSRWGLDAEDMVAAARGIIGGRCARHESISRLR